MEKYLKAKQSKVIDAYKSASQENKTFLLNLYGAKDLNLSVMETLTGYESACDIKGVKPRTLKEFEDFYGDKNTGKRMFARHKISTGISVVNEWWVPDYSNTNQPKYEIWVQKTNNGFDSFVFSDDGYYSVGSDLHIETREKAELIERTFKQDLIDYNITQ